MVLCQHLTQGEGWQFAVTLILRPDQLKVRPVELFLNSLNILHSHEVNLLFHNNGHKMSDVNLCCLLRLCFK